MKIFAGYKPTEQPWGGANNFLRALYKTLEENHSVQVVYEPSADCNLFFFGQTSRGPLNEGAPYTANDISGIVSLNTKAPVVMRMVNLRRHTSHKYPFTYWINTADKRLDADTKEAARLCDHLIFQSTYQKENFAQDKITSADSTIIHNGAAAVFSAYRGGIEKLQPGHKMRIFASAVSTKGWKNHAVIAAAGQNDSVEVLFAGEWPKNTVKGNIRFLGRLDHSQILETARTAHYFLHPSLKEACSNSIIESLAMGLPVLHGKTGSSPEIVKGNGLPVDLKGLDEQLRYAALAQPGLVDRLAGQRSRYSMANTARQYFETFQAAINRKAVR